MKLHKLASMFASTSIALSAFADDHGGDSPDYLSPFNVIGTKADIADLEGSGTVLNSDDLGPFFHTDVTEILRQVPGVYVRPEEGYGLFPNISIRGTDPNRSQKVTILEDGIPASPSPFSGPAAYYSPTAGRMAGFEILKGSSQLKYGPNNSGGVINYISTPIPQEQTSKIRASYGDFNTKIAHAYSGGTVDFAGGKLGYLLEVFDHRTDGWKTVSDDYTTDGISSKGMGFYKGGDAPVYKNDMLFKLGYEFGEGNYIEFKAGRTDLDGDVSYVGLSKADFEANPYQRYAATVLDNMDSDQTRYYLRYLKEISETTKISAAIFSNEFNRDWYKLAKVDNGIKNRSIGEGALRDSSYTDVLKGDANGTIRYKHNDRKYETKGIQANLDFDIGNNSFDLGFRYTDDKYTYKPNYTEDYYSMSTTSGLSLTKSTVGTKYEQTYRDSEALEVYLIDEIDFGNLTLTPGIRYTDVDFNRHGPKSDGTYENDETTVSDTLLGIGSTYDLGSNIVYAGLHQGHALPGPGSDYEEEKSLGFEIGIRSKGNSNFYYDVAFFNTSFEDMLIYPSVGSGTKGTQVGEVSISGVEVLIGTDIGNESVGIPLQASMTFSDSQFDTSMDLTKGDDEDRWDDATAGNSLPYIPEFQLNVRAGLELEKFSTYLNYHYQDKVYVDGSNKSPFTGFDATIPSYGVLDWSGFFQIKEGVTAFAKVTNLADEKYAMSDLPDGYRPGAPRIWSLGMEFDF